MAEELSEEKDEVLQEVRLLTAEEFCTSDLYPQEAISPQGLTGNEHVKLIEHLGFVILGGCDINMWHLRFPEGWKKIPAPKAEGWCYVVDEHERARAAIFFQKSTTLLPTAHINYMSRYRPVMRHVSKIGGGKDYANSPIIGTVTDSLHKVLYQTRPVAMRYAYGTKKYGLYESRAREKLFSECEAWLNKRFPMWANILAYWED